MAQVGDRFEPGDMAPDSGFYRCSTACGHTSTNVQGHRLPPFPAGCRGAKWILIEKRPQ